MHALADVPCSVLAVEHLKSISSLFKYARIISMIHYKYGKITLNVWVCPYLSQS